MSEKSISSINLVKTIRHPLLGRITYRINFHEMDYTSYGIEVLEPEMEMVTILVEGFGSRGNSKQKLVLNSIVVPQFEAAWKEITAAGLNKLVLTVDGGYNPRTMRNSTKPSSHAFGLAFDINAAWNPQGQTPAKWGEKGTVRPLVPYFKKYGFSWGGLWKLPKKDGMHFQTYKIMFAKDL
jgi:hypothetical protein